MPHGPEYSFLCLVGGSWLLLTEIAASADMYFGQKTTKVDVGDFLFCAKSMSSQSQLP
jgi:hypothetical protein